MKSDEVGHELGQRPLSIWGFLGILAIAVAAYSLLGQIGLSFRDRFRPAGLHSDPNTKLFFTFLSQFLIHIVLYCLVVFVHKRRYFSLIGSRENWLNSLKMSNNFALGMLLLYEPAFILINNSSFNCSYQENLTTWFFWILPFCFVIMMQVLAEEMFFRGYLQPYLKSYYPKPWVYIFIPALLWALPHWSNIEGLHLQITFVFFIFVLGLVLGKITEDTNSLVFSTGLHFIMNMFTVCIYGNNFRADSMTLISADFRGLSLDMQSLYYLMATIALIICYLFWRRRFLDL